MNQHDSYEISLTERFLFAEKTTKVLIDSLHNEISHLKELHEQTRASDREAITIVLTAADRAIAKAEEANEKRLDLLNEFREQSRDRDNAFLRTDVYNERHESLVVAVNILRERVSTIEGRILAIATLAAVVSIIGATFKLIIG